MPLTAVGEAQARALGGLLDDQRFGLVLTSPLQRARRTAELAGLRAALPDDDLVEWDYGAFEGRTTQAIRAELHRPWTVFDDGGLPSERAARTLGESLAHVAVRARRVLERVAPVIERGDDVALVGHAHQLRVLTACWLGLEPVTGSHLALSAGSLSRLGHEHETPVIRQWNLLAGAD